MRAGRGRRRGQARHVSGEFREREQPRPRARELLRAGERARPGGDHRRRPDLGADPDQALGGETGVERQVPATRLHDRQDGADLLDAALQVDADDRLRARADAAEGAREAAG
jgi:hypothetical protein